MGRPRAGFKSEEENGSEATPAGRHPVDLKRNPEADIVHKYSGEEFGVVMFLTHGMKLPSKKK